MLAHPSLLGGCRLRAAAQQHGRSGEVLRRPPEERRGISVGVGVNVRASVGALVVVERRPACRRRRRAAVRLTGSQTTLAPVAVPLAGLPLHRNVLRQASIVIPFSGLPLHRYALRRLSIAGLGIHAKILV
jgi:hypothetical protein